MKKIIILFILTILIIPTMNAFPSEISEKKIQSTNVDFTHTVFAEYAATTWCPNCPTSTEAINEVFESDEYDLLYISLVTDVNENAADRSWGNFRNVAIPSVYFDGGNDFFVGHSGSVSATKNTYRGFIEENGVRDVKSIDLNTQASWDGDAKITVTVTVTNSGSGIYLGKLRSYVTEIVSRWEGSTGNPFHYALLDFAINKVIFLMPGQSKTITEQWDGAADHQGITFEDIQQDNIQVFSAVFNWIPHYRKGYETATYTQQFFAFYADEADTALPI
jgi:hypothetical protein